MEPYTAIADPVRRRIVERLATGEKTAGQLGAGFRISQPAISKHLRVLREAGLVIARAESQRRFYRLNPAPLAEVESWLVRCRRLSEDHRDSLKPYSAKPNSDTLRLVSGRYPGRVWPDRTGWNAARWRRPTSPDAKTAA